MSRRWYDGIQLEELKRDQPAFKYVEDKMKNTIVHKEVTGYQIQKIYRLNNKYTWSHYKNRRAAISEEMGGRHVEEKRLFHGSPKADTIAKEGFDRGFAKDSCMFGSGVYFAEHSSKSNNFAFGNHQPCPTHNNKKCSICVRSVLLCKVALGRIYETTLSTVSALPAGYHSVKANPGLLLLFPEYIIYDDKQVYPRFLIEYTTDYASDGPSCTIV
ncbi:poly [ADP-ribose] polymerase tankyrase-2-like [Cloeon dipterum]|uniref:poly [ADP-ribose] polymerase tankyrase-2-like n=1 Tax=Cloeon dipterum TaxID=197152 RepID=UPI0032202A02